MPTKRTWLLGGRIFLAAAAAFVVVATGLSQLEVWDPPEPLSIVAIVITAIATFLYAIGRAVRDWQREDKIRDQQEMHLSAVACMSAVVELTGVPFESIGCNVFVVRRRWFWLRRQRFLVPWRWPRRLSLLDRELRLRIRDDPQPSPVDWFSGKGAIGKAWEKGRPQHVNWVAVAAKYGDGELTQAQFDRIPKATRAGFTFEEFSAVLTKYAEVKAVPMVSRDGAVLGVVAMDLPLDTPGAGSLLATKDVELAVVTAAVLLRKRLFRS